MVIETKLALQTERLKVTAKDKYNKSLLQSDETLSIFNICQLTS